MVYYAYVDSDAQFDYLNVAIFAFLLLLLLLILVPALLRYSHFRYQLLEEGIQVRQGVLFKKQLNLKFKRIQNINIKHPFYFRPLNLVTLKIDGAGSEGDEVHLAALTLENAEAIRQTVQAKKTQADNIVTGESADAQQAGKQEQAIDDNQAFYTRSLADLVIHGLTNNRAWMVVGGVAGILQPTSFSVADAINFLQDLAGSLTGSESIAGLLTVIIVSLVLAVAVIAILSVVGSIIAYYGFTLYRSDRSLMVHRGLINKQEINMRKSRVQSIYFRQDWLALVLKRVNIIFEQISHDTHEVAGVENSKKILVPSVGESERTELAREIFNMPDVNDLEFQPISKRYFYKHVVIWSIIYAAVPVIVDITSVLNGLAVLLAIWLLHVFLLYLHWLRAGLARANDYVVVRKGIVGIDYIVFPAYKLQVVDHVQSLLMKRHSLSDVIFHTASRTARVAYLPTEFVKELLDYCLYSVESDSRSWM